MLDPNEQFSVKQGNVEIVYRKRADGTLYATTRAVVSAATGWTCGGLFLFAFAISSWWDAKQGIATGALSMGHGHAMYRVADPARFDTQIKLDQHTAGWTAALAATCIAIGVALWIRKRFAAPVA